MVSSDSDSDRRSPKTKVGKNGRRLLGRIKKPHRLEMEQWLSSERVYTGGKTGARQKNIRWCLGGGEKGVKGMSSDSKESKSSGAFERMAIHMNRKFSLKGTELWTASIAETRFKNIMKTFRDACRKNPLPREKDFGSEKNDYASALEACHEKRKKKCPSYIPLWISCGLKDHPKYSSAGKMESGADSDSDDFEIKEESQKECSDDSSSEDGSSESYTSSDDDAANKTGEVGAMATQPSPKSAASPKSPTSGGAPGVGVKRTSSGAFRKAIVVKKRKFSLRKEKSTTKHQDIVQAYLLCKQQQNEHFLQLGILAQRRGVFFECYDRGITEIASIQAVYNAIGIGTIPAQFLPTFEAMQRGGHDEQGQSQLETQNGDGVNVNDD
jgi:hypothetical protein